MPADFRDRSSRLFWWTFTRTICTPQWTQCVAASLRKERDSGFWEVGPVPVRSSPTRTEVRRGFGDGILRFALKPGYRACLAIDVILAPAAALAGAPICRVLCQFPLCGHPSKRNGNIPLGTVGGISEQRLWG